MTVEEFVCSLEAVKVGVIVGVSVTEPDEVGVAEGVKVFVGVIVKVGVAVGVGV